MKNKLSIIILISFIVYIYSQIVYFSCDLNNAILSESDKITLFIQNKDNIYYEISYGINDGSSRKIYIKCASKYVLDMESKYTVHYDCKSVIINSFERDVYSKSIVGVNCIEKSYAPASSYNNMISWYNTFNVIGCNITVVTLVFDIINPYANRVQKIYFNIINHCGNLYVSVNKKNQPDKSTG